MVIGYSRPIIQGSGGEGYVAPRRTVLRGRDWWFCDTLKTAQAFYAKHQAKVADIVKEGSFCVDRGKG